jgi:hypothetical protein
MRKFLNNKESNLPANKLPHRRFKIAPILRPALNLHKDPKLLPPHILSLKQPINLAKPKKEDKLKPVNTKPTQTGDLLEFLGLEEEECCLSLGECYYY